MPPRNSKTKPFPAYNLVRSRETEASLKAKADLNRLANKQIDTFANMGKYYRNKEYCEFEEYKRNTMAVKGTIVDESIYKSEEESDPRYRNKQWYRDRANGIEGGWDIDHI